VDTKLVRVCGDVKTSLFDAMAEAGENSDLALQLADVFCHQVDFVNDVQEGDSFEVIVEKRYLEGNFRGYGDIVAARFHNDGIMFEAFRFEDEDGVGHYYAADGSSLETQFLKAPLNFTRISSRYSLSRRHPVFGKVRPHEGVDYAAPRGTPVKALGEGEVTFVGWKPGYGRSVAIKHNGGVDTHYAHLARYAKALKRGDKVEQGQVIGYVGASGTATGPHLDFRVRKNGRYIDPLKLTGNRTDPIPFDKKLVFETMMQRARLMLDGEVILAGM
jgi:murein DD-endopeptidase MepM/ murein hydrolase activator NlpD